VIVQALPVELDPDEHGSALEGPVPSLQSAPVLPERTLLDWRPDRDPSLSGLRPIGGSNPRQTTTTSTSDLMSDFLKQVAIAVFAGAFATLGALMAMRTLWTAPEYDQAFRRRVFRIALVFIWSAVTLTSAFAYVTFR
jgi:hypothetical protein